MSTTPNPPSKSSNWGLLRRTELRRFSEPAKRFAEEKKAIVDQAVEAVDPNPANTLAARQAAARQAAENDNKFSMDDIQGALEEVVNRGWHPRMLCTNSEAIK